ncbi:hypothetical protein F5Y19DRAFT_412854 [Xylariaceae sp. FL1651]|nr:hypothetical protein F5Y19DRAFT_412854 [Xylariaceae sp. FL1651]
MRCSLIGMLSLITWTHWRLGAATTLRSGGVVALISVVLPRRKLMPAIITCLCVGPGISVMSLETFQSAGETM